MGVFLIHNPPPLPHFTKINEALTSSGHFLMLPFITDLLGKGEREKGILHVKSWMVSALTIYNSLAEKIGDF